MSTPSSSEQAPLAAQTRLPALSPFDSSQGLSLPKWFAEEVHAHDSVLKSYLRRSFPSAREDVDDVVQESYLRVWKARATQPIGSAKNFLFTVARRLVIDGLRRNRISPVVAVPDLASLFVMENGPGVAELACTPLITRYQFIGNDRHVFRSEPQAPRTWRFTTNFEF